MGGGGGSSQSLSSITVCLTWCTSSLGIPTQKAGNYCYSRRSCRWVKGKRSFKFHQYNKVVGRFQTSVASDLFLWLQCLRLNLSPWFRLCVPPHGPAEEQRRWSMNWASSALIGVMFSWTLELLGAFLVLVPVAGSAEPPRVAGT